MKMIFTALLISAAALGKVTVENARIRLMPPGWKSTAAFAVVKNATDKDLDLVSASGDFARKIELHTHKIEDGVMRMRQVDKMPLPAKGELVLKPHDNHLMIFGMKSDLKEGAAYEIVLTFADKDNAKSKTKAKFKAVKIGMKHGKR